MYTCNGEKKDEIITYIYEILYVSENIFGL